MPPLVMNFFLTPLNEIDQKRPVPCRRQRPISCPEVTAEVPPLRKSTASASVRASSTASVRSRLKSPSCMLSSTRTVSHKRLKRPIWDVEYESLQAETEPNPPANKKDLPSALPSIWRSSYSLWDPKESGAFPRRKLPDSIRDSLFPPRHHRPEQKAPSQKSIKTQQKVVTTLHKTLSPRSRSSSVPSLPDASNSSLPRAPRSRTSLPLPSLPGVGTSSLPRPDASQSPSVCTVSDRRETPFTSEEWSLGTSSVLQECDQDMMGPTSAPSDDVSYSDDRSSGPHSGTGWTETDFYVSKDKTNMNQEDDYDLLARKTIKNAPPEVIKVWATAFEKLSNKSLLPCTSIHSALQLIGHSSTDVNIVEAALKKACKGSTKDSITLMEFSVFVAMYESSHEEHLQCLFKKADTDGDGDLSRQELGALIREMDIKMCFPQVIDELFTEVDANQDGGIDMAEFREVMRILRQRQGCSRQDANDMLQVFKRFAEEHTGEVQVSELRNLLKWLGYHPQEQELADLIMEIDFDKSGSISQVEFPLFLRKVRELELEKAGHFFEAVVKHGAIELAEMEDLLSELGYTMKRSSILSFLDETNLSRAVQQGLLFEDFFRLKTYIRKNEGFTAAEKDEYYSAWARYADPPEGVKEKHLVAMEDRRAWQLPKCKVAHVLRWLGVSCSSSIQELEAVVAVLVDEVDYDHSQSLDFEKFLKMMRNLQKEFANIILQAFSSPDNSQRVTSKIALDSPDLHQRICFNDRFGQPLNGILHKLGIKVSSQQKEAVFQKMGISATGDASFFECLAIVQEMRDTNARFMREMAGFTEDEVTEWRKVFHKFTHSFGLYGRPATKLVNQSINDRDHSQTMTQDKMQRMMQCRIMSGPLNQIRQNSTEDEIKLIFEDAHKAGMGEGGIDFSEFLQVMRAHVDRVELKKLREKCRLFERNKTEELVIAVDLDSSPVHSKEELHSMLSPMLQSVLSSSMQFEMQSKLESPMLSSSMQSKCNPNLKG